MWWASFPGQFYWLGFLTRGARVSGEGSCAHFGEDRQCGRPAGHWKVGETLDGELPGETSLAVLHLDSASADTDSPAVT